MAERDQGASRRDETERRSRDRARREEPREARRATARTSVASEYASLDDATLVNRMRREDARAFTEFVVRFQGLLFDRAHRMGLRREDVEDVVIEVLAHAAQRLVSGRATVPRSVPAYLVTSFRNRYLTHVRERTHRREFVEGVAADANGASEPVVTELCSEDALRASAGPDWPGLSLPPALERLASALDEGLTEDERTMLAWLSHFVPQRQIGDWLGLSYAAVTQRLWRLRERLREAALAYSNGLSREERHELAAFFRRTMPTAPIADPRAPTSSSSEPPRDVDDHQPPRSRS